MTNVIYTCIVCINKRSAEIGIYLHIYIYLLYLYIYLFICIETTWVEKSMAIVSKL